MADPLTIRSIQRVCDFEPTRPCLDTLYAPCYVFDPDPPIPARHELLYTMGGHIDSPQRLEFALTDPRRFADEVFVSWRDASGKWTPPQPCVGKYSFPWKVSKKTYDAEAFLEDHREAFIGCVGSPTVVKAGRVFHMMVSATVSDPHITTGDNHAGAPTVYGSRSEPWSYYALFWFTSLDGENWTIVNMGRDSENVALQYAAVFAEPAPSDLGFNHAREFVGAYQCTMLRDDPDIYVSFSYTGIAGQKSGLLKTAADRRDFSIWNGASWEPLIDGRLPRWFTDQTWSGVVYPHVPNQILHSPLVGSKYMLVTPGATQQADGSFLTSNRIEYAFSRDLVQWGEPQFVDSPLRLLNGSAPSMSILNPIMRVTPEGEVRAMWSSCVAANGKSACGEAGYVGAAIWEGSL